MTTTEKMATEGTETQGRAADQLLGSHMGASIATAGTPESADSAPKSLRWLIVLAAMTGAVLEVLDTTITATALPQIQGNLGATLSEVGWVNTGYIIANVIVLPMAGWLSNRFGRGGYFAGAIALFTIASLMCGFSHTLNALVFWRIVQGLGGGGLLATGQVILLEAFPPKQQGIATALFGVGVTVGPLLGPVLGGWLTENLSWPWIFYINLPFGIAAAILTRLYVPDGADQGKGGQAAQVPIDFFGIGLLAVGMGSLQAVLERGQEEDWFQSRFITGLAVSAAVGLTLFVWWELRAAQPVLNLRVLKNRSLTAGALFGAVLGFGLYATIFLLPVYQQALLGYNAYASGFVQFKPALFGMLSFMAAGILSQKADVRVLLAFGTVLFILCPWGLSHLTTASGDDDVFLPLVLRGASLGFLFIPLTLASLGRLSSSDRDTGSGIVNFMRQFGGSVGIAAMTTVLARRADFHRVSLVSQIGAGTPQMRDWLGGAQAQLQSQGYGPTAAHTGALQLLNGAVQRQATMLSFNDCFLIVAALFCVGLPLVFLFQKTSGAQDMGAVH